MYFVSISSLSLQVQQLNHFVCATFRSGVRWTIGAVAVLVRPAPGKTYLNPIHLFFFWFFFLMIPNPELIAVRIGLRGCSGFDAAMRSYLCSSWR